MGAEVGDRSPSNKRDKEKLARYGNESTSFGAENDEGSQLDDVGEKGAYSKEEGHKGAEGTDDVDEQELDQEEKNQDENRRVLAELAKAADTPGKEETSQSQGSQGQALATGQHDNHKREPNVATGLKLYKTKMDASSKKLLDSYATKLCGGKAGTYRFPDSIRVTYHPKGSDPTPIKVLQLDVQYKATPGRPLDIRGFLPTSQLPEGVVPGKSQEFCYELCPPTEGEQLPLLTIVDEATQALSNEQHQGLSKKRNRKSQGQDQGGTDRGKRAKGAEEEVSQPDVVNGGCGARQGSESARSSSRLRRGSGNRDQQQQQQQQQQNQGKEEKAAEVPKAGDSDWAQMVQTLRKALRLLEADDAQMRRWWRWAADPNSTVHRWCRQVLGTWDIHDAADREDLCDMFALKDQELLASSSPSAELHEPPMPLPPPAQVPATSDMDTLCDYLRSAVVALRDTHALGKKEVQPLMRALLKKAVGAADVQHCCACVQEAWKNHDASTMTWALLAVLHGHRVPAHTLDVGVGHADDEQATVEVAGAR